MNLEQISILFEQKRKQPAAVKDKNLKILIIRFSSIGDIVLTSPVIRCLKEQLEGLESPLFN
jgi:hypothetical protein